MKKQYLSPACEALSLPTGRLFTTAGSVPVSNETADEGGWSRKFWGLTENEEEDKDFDWE